MEKAQKPGKTKREDQWNKQCIPLFPSSPSQMTDVGENFNFGGAEEREQKQ